MFAIHYINILKHTMIYINNVTKDLYSCEE